MRTKTKQQTIESGNLIDCIGIEVKEEYQIRVAGVLVTASYKGIVIDYNEDAQLLYISFYGMPCRWVPADRLQAIN